MQADKLDKYNCLRCHIKSSFKAAYAGAAKLVNTWMRPGETAKLMDTKRLKIVKRINRDENELDLLTRELKKCHEQKEILTTLNAEITLEDVDASTASRQVEATVSSPYSEPTVADSSATTESTNDGMEVAAQDSQPSYTDTTTDPIATNVIAAATNTSGSSAINSDNLPSISATVASLESRIFELKGAISALQSRVVRAKKDEDDLCVFFCLSVQGRHHLTEWMLSMRKMLWPSTPEEVASGFPVKTGLPAAVRAGMNEAAALGLYELSDIRQLEDYFLWMSWCYKCLDCIRAPPKTRELKALLSEAKQCKMAEDKIIKALGGMLSRAQ